MDTKRHNGLYTSMAEIPHPGVAVADVLRSGRRLATNVVRTLHTKPDLKIVNRMVFIADSADVFRATVL